MNTGETGVDQPPATTPPRRPSRGDPRPVIGQRSSAERAKRLKRRANPWYRRIARRVIGSVLVVAVALGGYAAFVTVRGQIDENRLPAPGAAVPRIASSSFVVVSTSPAPVLDGTLSLDTGTLAFDFVGRDGGVHDGARVVSPDGSTVYVRQRASEWRTAVGGDALVDAVRTAVTYLADDDTADDILTNRLRIGYVELLARSEERNGEDYRTAYQLSVDSEAFARDFPLQWGEFLVDAVPGAVTSPEHAITIWLDSDSVLVAVRDDTTNWSWERLDYSDQPLMPFDPSLDPGTRIVQVACVSDDGSVFWQTPFPSCDDALVTARTAAAAAGIDPLVDIDSSVAVLCSTMDNGSGPTAVTATDFALARIIVDALVCRGDPSMFSVG